ncbi:TPA-induced transmembrane protein [Macrotis lagotis]|uniref:TPA-induced transmembrane protein n=1 Tax=Macrotis lagotis TaxID=92651 RepID=UPI003D69AFD0
MYELRPLPEEEEPLNGAVPQERRLQVEESRLQVEESRLQVEDPEPVQVRRQNPWKFCNEPVKGRCKLWMAIVSIIIGFILMIFISYIIHEASYSDEDENEILELASNKTFMITLKVPEECMDEEDTLSNELSQNLTKLYNTSPALSRYFASVEVADSSDNSTVAYQLHFAVPLEDNFMKYMMSEELVLGILRQHFHDQSDSRCKTLGIDPASLTIS